MKKVNNDTEKLDLLSIKNELMNISANVPASSKEIIFSSIAPKPTLNKKVLYTLLGTAVLASSVFIYKTTNHKAEKEKNITDEVKQDLDSSTNKGITPYSLSTVDNQVPTETKRAPLPTTSKVNTKKTKLSQTKEKSQSVASSPLTETEETSQNNLTKVTAPELTTDLTNKTEDTTPTLTSSIAIDSVKIEKNTTEESTGFNLNMGSKEETREIFE